MATIYRFIIENKESAKSSGRKGGESGGSASSRKTTAKKGKALSFLGGEKGGVEHNRKLRAINPLLNRATGGAWEKGMRVGRAGIGLINDISENGITKGLMGVGATIIISFVLQSLLKWQNSERAKAEKLNTQNYKALENGFGSIHGQYQVAKDVWNGAITYNENK